ncbi:myosin-2 heavy chain [Oryzias melastigma]|uniref:myosin-2 heavy chain n=1 Tax=Oryzias melastigma TaxID=30732 RepID=UPI000CF7C6DB|nr:myosin-2 heavy chain [Oryzias melastigma]
MSSREMSKRKSDNKSTSNNSKLSMMSLKNLKNLFQKQTTKEERVEQKRQDVVNLCKTIESLQEECNSLQAILQPLDELTQRKKIVKLQKRVLKRKKAAQLIELNKLQKKVALQQELELYHLKKSAQCRQLERETSGLQHQIGMLRLQILETQDTENILPAMMKRKQRFADLKEDLEDELRYLREERAKAEEQFAEHPEKHQLDLLIEETNNLQKTKEALTKSLKRLQDLGSDSDKVQAVIQKKKKKNKNLSREVQELQQEIKLLSTEQERLDSLKAENIAAQGETLLLKKNMTALRRQVLKLQELTAASKQEVENLEKHLPEQNQIKEDFSKLLEEKCGLEKLHQGLESQISDLKVQNTNAKKQLEQKIDCSNLLKVKVKEAWTESSQNHKVCESEWLKVRAETHKTVETNSDLFLEVIELEDEIEGLGDVQESFDILEEENFAAKNDNDSLQAKVLKHQVKNLQQETAASSQELEDLQKHLQKKDHLKISTLMEEKSFFQKTKKDLENEILDLKLQEKKAEEGLAMYNKAKAEFDLLKEETTNLQKIKVALTESVQNLKNVDLAYQNVKEETKKKRESTLILYGEVEKLQEELSTLDNKKILLAAKEKHSAANNENKFLEQERESLREHVTRFKQQNLAFTREFDGFRSKNNQRRHYAP